RGEQRLLRARRADALAHARGRPGAVRAGRRGPRAVARRRWVGAHRGGHGAHPRGRRALARRGSRQLPAASRRLGRQDELARARRRSRLPVFLRDWLMLQVLLSGLAIGAIYGLVGMGFAIAFYVTRVINFAQGQLLMVGVMVAAAVSR